MLRHGAPAVSFAVEPSRLLRQVGWAWCGFALGVQGLWFAQSGVHWLGPLAGTLLTLVLGAWAGCELRRAPTGLLAWDGEAWSFTPLSGQPLHGELPLRVLLDAQFCLLLAWPASAARGPQRWFFLERAQAPSRWHALRCAVYSRAATRPPTRSPRS